MCGLPTIAIGTNIISCTRPDGEQLAATILAGGPRNSMSGIASASVPKDGRRSAWPRAWLYTASLAIQIR